MSQGNHWRFSLGKRFLLWQLVVLGPLLLAAMFHHLYLMPNFIQPLVRMANQTTGEVLYVRDLQFLLLNSAIPVHDYLLHSKQSELAKLNTQRQRVADTFTRLHGMLLAETPEQHMLDTAWQEWRQAEQLAVKIMRDPAQVDMPGLSKEMKGFEHHIDSAIVSLGDLYQLIYSKIKIEQQQTDSARATSQQLTVAAFIIALLLSLFLGSSLTRSILLSLKSLRLGARKIADGELGHPQLQACGIEELEELAVSFNSMATKLQARDAELKDLSNRDALTGLENRRALNDCLTEELYRAKRYQHPLSLLMLDIDHFKNVNDTYGHVAGDAVLRKLADTIMPLVRPVDRIFRYGGEEFVVLIPETKSKGAVALAERIREVVSKTHIPLACSAEEINITISLGSATYPGDADTPEALIIAADNAMYQAKQHGRNRVCIYTGLVKA